MAVRVNRKELDSQLVQSFGAELASSVNYPPLKRVFREKNNIMTDHVQEENGYIDCLNCGEKIYTLEMMEGSDYIECDSCRAELFLEIEYSKWINIKLTHKKDKEGGAA